MTDTNTDTAAEETPPAPPLGATIRAQLERHGLEHLVERISAGRHRYLIRIRDCGGTPVEMARRAWVVAAALRELWDDGEQRVHATHGAQVVINRATS